MLLPDNFNNIKSLQAMQEFSLNSLKGNLYSSIVGQVTQYFLTNHSNPSGSLDLDQIENIVELSFQIYEESFVRLMEPKK